MSSEVLRKCGATYIKYKLSYGKGECDYFTGFYDVTQVDPVSILHRFPNKDKLQNILPKLYDDATMEVELQSSWLYLFTYQLSQKEKIKLG